MAITESGVGCLNFRYLNRCTLVWVDDFQSHLRPSWLFVDTFNFIFSIGQRFQPDPYKVSHLQQYLFVKAHFK
jgi:hypothetical protein